MQALLDDPDNREAPFSLGEKLTIQQVRFVAWPLRGRQKGASTPPKEPVVGRLDVRPIDGIRRPFDKGSRRR